MSERILATERAEHWWDENINSPTTTMTNEQWRTNVSVLIRVAEKQARAEVLAACAIAVEEECDKVPGCDSDWPRRIMNVILQLQPAASALEALLREEREKWLAVLPRIAHDEDGSVWMHVQNAAINLSVRHGPIIKKALLAWADKLEKARASKGKG